jgi:hypothetical protein
MLINHIAQHVAALLTKSLAAQSTSAPRDFLPNQEAEFIAKIKHEWSLLVVTQTHKISPHFLHECEGLPDNGIGHSRSHAGVILVIVCAPEQEALPIYFERSVFDPLHRPDSKVVNNLLSALIVRKRRAETVKLRRIRTPESRPLNKEC